MIALLIFAYMAAIFGLLWICVIGIWVADKITGPASTAASGRTATPLLDKVFTLLWSKPDDDADAKFKVVMIVMGLGIRIGAVALTVAIFAVAFAPWLPAYLMGLDPFAGLH